MKSMTGFGRAIAEHDGTRVVAEVRALNQRFFELKLAVPRGWGEHEAEIRKTVQNVVARGRVVENYSMDKMAARTLALYRECVRKRMKGAAN